MFWSFKERLTGMGGGMWWEMGCGHSMRTYLQAFTLRELRSLRKVLSSRVASSVSDGWEGWLWLPGQEEMGQGVEAGDQLGGLASIQARDGPVSD